VRVFNHLSCVHFLIILYVTTITTITTTTTTIATRPLLTPSARTLNLQTLSAEDPQRIVPVLRQTRPVVAAVILQRVRSPTNGQRRLYSFRKRSLVSQILGIFFLLFFFYKFLCFRIEHLTQNCIAAFAILRTIILRGHRLTEKNRFKLI
jgi:hypothetical protein